MMSRWSLLCPAGIGVSSRSVFQRGIVTLLRKDSAG